MKTFYSILLISILAIGCQEKAPQELSESELELGRIEDEKELARLEQKNYVAENNEKKAKLEQEIASLERSIKYAAFDQKVLTVGMAESELKIILNHHGLGILETYRDPSEIAIAGFSYGRMIEAYSAIHIWDGKSGANPLKGIVYFNLYGKIIKVPNGWDEAGDDELDKMISDLGIKKAVYSILSF
jgi:hypothetical protein